ncbi:MAG: hypothetical protein AAF384_11900 [Pseudomonadota bacterium]
MTQIRRVLVLIAITLGASVSLAPSALAFSVAENPNNALDTFPNSPGEALIGFNGVTTLVVELGLNIAIGGLGNCIGFSCNDSYDSFRMEVPDGLQVTLTEFDVDNIDGTAEQLWIFAGPPDGNGVIRTPEHLNTAWQTATDRVFALTDNIFINGTDPSSTTIPLGPGFYDVIAFNLAFVGGGAFTATFTASELVVPIPATLGLLAPALMVLAGLRRVSPATD